MSCAACAATSWESNFSLSPKSLGEWAAELSTSTASARNWREQTWGLPPPCWRPSSAATRYPLAERPSRNGIGCRVSRTKDCSSHTRPRSRRPAATWRRSEAPPNGSPSMDRSPHTGSTGASNGSATEGWRMRIRFWRTLRAAPAGSSSKKVRTGCATIGRRISTGSAPATPRRSRSTTFAWMPGGWWAEWKVRGCCKHRPCSGTPA